MKTPFSYIRPSHNDKETSALSFKLYVLIALISFSNTATHAQISGSGTIDYLPKFTGNTSIGNSLIRQGNGNNKQIMIDGPITISDNCSVNSLAMLHIKRPAMLLVCPGGTAISNDMVNIQGQKLISFIPFVTEDLDYFRILGNGKIGIGLNAPPAQLAIKPINNNDPFQILNNSNSTLLKVLANGRIGIGLDAPTAQLAIKPIDNNDPFQIFNNSNSTLLKVLANGRIGIGSATPYSQLDIFPSSTNNSLIVRDASGFPALFIRGGDGRIAITGDMPQAQLDITARAGVDPFLINNSSSQHLMRVRSNGDVSITTGKVEIGSVPTGNYSNYKLRVNGDVSFTAGKVEIGSAPTGSYSNYKLSVNGDIVAKRLVVQTAYWADEVFDNNYKLLSLEEIEAYIKENCHLPKIPSETEVLEKGIDTGEMNRLLLQKVEELTLHLIAMQKELHNLKGK